VRTTAFLAGKAATFAEAFPTIDNITAEVVRGEYYSAGKHPAVHRGALYESDRAPVMRGAARLS
jgi:hypothetical protein